MTDARVTEPEHNDVETTEPAETRTWDGTTFDDRDNNIPSEELAESEERDDDAEEAPTVESRLADVEAALRTHGLMR